MILSNCGGGGRNSYGATEKQPRVHLHQIQVVETTQGHPPSV